MKRYIKAKIVPLSDESYDFRMEVALDPDTDSTVLDSLVDSNHLTSEMIRSIAEHPNVSVDTLIKLYEKFPYSVVANYLAKNPNTSTEILDTLIDQCWLDIAVVAQIAKNPNITDKQLRKVANIAFEDPDGYYDTCYELSGRNDTPPDILARLSKHFDRGVRRNVFTNPNTPKEVRERLREQFEY